MVARLLVEIDEELKKELKVRLIREGQTLKDWLTQTAQQYVDARAEAAPREQPRRVVVRSNDYVD